MPNKETGIVKPKTDGGLQTTKDLIAAIKMALDDATRKGRKEGYILWPNVGDATPWPLGYCVSHLLVAVRHLFDAHDCDHAGFRTWEAALPWADRYLRNALEEIERLKLTGEIPLGPFPWRSPLGADPVEDIKAAQEMIRSPISGDVRESYPRSIECKICQGWHLPPVCTEEGAGS